MLIKEFRIPLPLSVEEYRIGQLYSITEASKNNTGGGEGIEVVKNEPFTNYPLLGNKYTEGQYTYKIYHIASKVPAFIRLLAPKDSLEIHEEAWNSYPYCRTIITNPKYMKDNFLICIESMHMADAGHQNNVHELSFEKLQEREIIFIDIANDPVCSSDYKIDEDPTKFQSKKSGRGPLIGPNWQEHMEPVMTCYKLVTVEFKKFGFQTRIENFIQDSQQRIFTNFHRQVFCWMDRWYGLTMDNIREIEENTQRELKELRLKGEIKGMTSE